ncbi:hypothetical protein ABUE34_07430 [Kozakia baliensis]|uniref:hypothetical protein n=1 Tax=Kozakia baliensis TaxID=153496 RepID=UPI00345C11E3
MFIAPYDSSIISQRIGLIWSVIGMDRDALFEHAAQCPVGTGLLVDASQAKWLRETGAHLRIFVREGENLVRTGWDGAQIEQFRLYENCLPSQIVDHPPHSAVALDIVMADHTQAAWECTESLIATGLPAPVAASALIGTPAEIALRLGDYRALGIHDIVLTAPPERAPYEAVCEKLLPLLTTLTPEIETRPQHDTVTSGTFDWHGAAL